MKKPRTQRSFKGLTAQEIDQIAEWLRHDTYDVVLARIRRPRAEGGFGLDISRSPLARLHGKTNIVQKINERLATGEQLTVSALDAINASEAPASEVVHDAIMNATHALAKDDDNTPSDLRTLQTLADFPARAELRAERHEILLAREDRAQAREERAAAKAERDAQMHTHKIALDLQKEERAQAKAERDQELHTQKIQNNSDRAALAFARYELAKLTFAFRQQQHQDRLTLQREKLSAQISTSKSKTQNSKLASQSDELGPYATNWDEVEQRVCKQFGISPEELARRNEIAKTWKQPHANPKHPLEINPV